MRSDSVSAKVITVGRMVHGADQGVLVRAEVSDGAQLLRPGQFLQANLQGPETADLYRVPRTALVRSGGESYLFVETPQGFSAERVDVQTEETNHIIISGSLATDVRLAISGTAALKAAWQSGAE